MDNNSHVHYNLFNSYDSHFHLNLIAIWYAESEYLKFIFVENHFENIISHICLPVSSKANEKGKLYTSGSWNETVCQTENRLPCGCLLKTLLSFFKK